MVRTYHHFLLYWVCTKTMKCHDRTSIQGLLDFQIEKHLKKSKNKYFNVEGIANEIMFQI